MPADPIPEPRPGEFVGPVCPYCGAWGEGLCNTKSNRDHPSRRRAEIAWYDARDLSPEQSDGRTT